MFSRTLFFFFLNSGVGLLCGFLFNMPLEYQLANFCSMHPVLTLSTISLVICMIVGFFIPIAANIIPLRRALSSTLRDSLDLTHHVIDEVVIHIEKLHKFGNLCFMCLRNALLEKICRGI